MISGSASALFSSETKSRTYLSAASNVTRQVVGKPCPAGPLTRTIPWLPFSNPRNVVTIASRIPRSVKVFSVGFLVSIDIRTRSPDGTPALMKETTQSMSLKLVANFASCLALRSTGFSPNIFFMTTRAASPVGRSSGGRPSQFPSIR